MHPGYSHVRTALETFIIPRPGGDHICLVQKPVWESFKDLKYRLPDGLFTEELLESSLKQLFLELDYLHTERRLVHTGARNSVTFTTELDITKAVKISSHLIIH